MTDNFFLPSRDDLSFKEPDEERWKVLIVDDEPEVHKITKLVLDDFTFEGRHLKFLCAYSGLEAVEIIRDNPDTAVILLDVVMEEQDSGLKVVKFVREKLKNTSVRIILKTGQPGMAPEREVISRYDINDYREKTELNDDKFFTAMTTALRSYRDITALLKSRDGLEMIIKSTAGNICLKSLNQLASGVLTQLGTLIGSYRGSLFCMDKSSPSARLTGELVILASTGCYENHGGKNPGELLEDDAYRDISKAWAVGNNIFTEKYSVLCFTNSFGSKGLIYIEGKGELDGYERELLKSFCINFSTAFDNLYLGNELLEGLREACAVINSCGQIVSCSRAFKKHLGEYAGLTGSDDSGLLIGYLTEYAEESEDRDNIIKAIRECHGRAEGVLTIEREHKVHYSVTVQPLKGADENIIGCIVMFYDISAYKNLYKEMAEKNRELQELFSEQKRFISAMEEMKSLVDSENRRMMALSKRTEGKLQELFKMIEEHLYKDKSPGTVSQLLKLFKDLGESFNRKDSYGKNGTENMEELYSRLVECLKKAERILLKKDGPYRLNDGIPLDELDVTILKLIARGKSNREIACATNYEEGSVKNRIRDIIKKVLPEGQGDKRCLLASYAYEMGYVDQYTFCEGSDAS